MRSGVVNRDCGTFDGFPNFSILKSEMNRVRTWYFLDISLSTGRYRCMDTNEMLFQKLRPSGNAFTCGMLWPYMFVRNCKVISVTNGGTQKFPRLSKHTEESSLGAISDGTIRFSIQPFSSTIFGENAFWIFLKRLISPFKGVLNG
jgi:hypothetical protein